MENVTLPQTFGPLLWSYDFERVDPLRHKKTIVVQTLNYGTLTQWRWLIQTYGREVIREIVAHTSAGEVKPRALRLASLVFGVDRLGYAPRGTH
jgi:hypothetical protein